MSEPDHYVETSKNNLAQTAAFLAQKDVPLSELIEIVTYQHNRITGRFINAHK